MSPPSASPTSARPSSSGTARPASRSTTPSSGRTAAPPTSAAACARPGTRRRRHARPGCCSIPISPAPRSPGCSTTCEGARARAERGELAFGTVDSFLLWRLTGGRVHATDATNASRTLLYNIRTDDWDDDAARAAARAASHAARGEGLRRRFRHDATAELFGAADPHLRHRRRPAGRDHRPGLLRAGHGEIHLRHRLFRPAQHRHGSRSPRATGCSRPSPTGSTA